MKQGVVKWAAMAVLAGLVTARAAEAADEQKDAALAPARFHIGQGYANRQNQQVKAEYTGDKEFSFPGVPGGLFGDTDEQAQAKIEAKGMSDFELILAPDAKGAARPLAQGGLNATLSISPTDTRVLRLGSFPFSAKDKHPLGGGGFIDADSRDGLLLVYFSQACELRGSVVFPKVALTNAIDVVIPFGGWHWLRSVKVDKHHSRIVRDPFPIAHPQFTVYASQDEK